MKDLERQPHAILDLPSRYKKGLKIERLLRLTDRKQRLRILEIGTGSGGIAHYFGTHPELICDVHAVDVHDNRLVTDGYEYQQVRGVELPFPDGEFDAVVTNHVIEHVGDEQKQRAHLAEVRRVLRVDGVGYLAVPNRWMVIEPHYGLPFLSWMPRTWRTPYLQAMRKGSVYDCEPLEMRRLEKMLSGAKFNYRNICIDALRITLDIEYPDSAATRILKKIPDGALMALRPLIPTMIYRLWQ